MPTPSPSWPAAAPRAGGARGGARRATDALEVFEMPLYDPGRACYETFFLAHGLRYLSPSSLDRIHRLVVSDRLFLVLDFQNPADRRAVALRTEDRTWVGYMPRYLLDDAWNLIQTCGWIEVFVAQVNPAPAPIEQRLLCRLRSCWPTDFRPFCSDAYKPIPADAVAIDCGRERG
jgi:hypothetical protein